MKWLILVFLLLIAGAILGPISSGNAGYVLVQFAGWSIETSVIALFILTVVAVVIVSLIVAITRAILQRGKASGQWFGKRRSVKASRELKQGQIALLEHDYLSALQAFEKSFKQANDSTTAALASYAAQRCNELGKAEFWRTQAGQDFEQADRIIKIKYIESISAQQPQLALTKLEELNIHHADKAFPWRLAIDLYSANQQWQKLIELLPTLKSQADSYKGSFNELKFSIYHHYFIQQGTRSSEQMYQYWRSLTKSQRRDTQIRLAYACALSDFGNNEACAKVVYKGLKRGELTIDEVNQKPLLWASYPKLVEHVQESLKQNPQHSGYIRALAMLAYDSKDYSLAQRALKKLVDAEAHAADYKLLGDVYNALGDSQLAANAYKRALA